MTSTSYLDQYTTCLIDERKLFNKAAREYDAQFPRLEPWRQLLREYVNEIRLEREHG